MSDLPIPNDTLFDKAKKAGFKMFITHGHAVSNAPFYEVQLVPYSNETEYNALPVPKWNNRTYLVGTVANRTILKQTDPQKYIDTWVNNTIDKVIKKQRG